jgi:hypothetical protein
MSLSSEASGKMGSRGSPALDPGNFGVSRDILWSRISVVWSWVRVRSGNNVWSWVRVRAWVFAKYSESADFLLLPELLEAARSFAGVEPSSVCENKEDPADDILETVMLRLITCWSG